MAVTGILIVDDEAPVRSFAAHALTHKGYRVFEAESAEEAFAVMHDYDKEIGVVIADVMMPGMTGPEMVRQLLPAHPALKVLFISGYTDSNSLKTAGLSDASFIAKPFTLADLTTQVDALLL